MGKDSRKRRRRRASPGDQLAAPWGQSSDVMPPGTVQSGIRLQVPFSTCMTRLCHTNADAAHAGTG